MIMRDSGSAPDPVHRHCAGHSRCVAETGTHSVPGAVPVGRRRARCRANAGARSCSVSTRSFSRSWRRGRYGSVCLKTIEISQLQSVDNVVVPVVQIVQVFFGASRGEDRRLPQLQSSRKSLRSASSWTRLLHARWRATTGVCRDSAAREVHRQVRRRPCRFPPIWRLWRR